MATTQSNFNLVSSHSEATFSIEKYQSKQTGMKLYHINIPLPLIKVEICVQTNPYDDTGCPHTLGKFFISFSNAYEGTFSSVTSLLNQKYAYHMGPNEL